MSLDKSDFIRLFFITCFRTVCVLMCRACMKYMEFTRIVFFLTLVSANEVFCFGGSETACCCCCCCSVVPCQKVVVLKGFYNGMWIVSPSYEQFFIQLWVDTINWRLLCLIYLLGKLLCYSILPLPLALPLLLLPLLLNLCWQCAGTVTWWWLHFNPLPSSRP